MEKILQWIYWIFGQRDQESTSSREREEYGNNTNVHSLGIGQSTEEARTISTKSHHLGTSQCCYIEEDRIYRKRPNHLGTSQLIFTEEARIQKNNAHKLGIIQSSSIKYSHINSHITIFSVSELRQLEIKCRTFTQFQYLSPVMQQICSFYRNKPPAYFLKIQQNGGYMVPYIKDMSGDKRCPINGRIDGLFFMTNLDRGSNNPDRLPPCSPFGSRRLIVPTQKLFNFTNKLYFSEFFCMKDHYVSLVITKPGSQADRYCQSHLLPLDVCDNPYLRLDGSGNVFALHRPGLWVEVMYTETVNVNMPGVRWDTVRTLGRGESTPGGIPKRTYCPHCNL